MSVFQTFALERLWVAMKAGMRNLSPVEAEQNSGGWPLVIFNLLNILPIKDNRFPPPLMLLNPFLSHYDR